MALASSGRSLRLPLSTSIVFGYQLTAALVAILGHGGPLGFQTEP